MKKVLTVGSMIILAVVVGAGLVYAGTDTWFKATGSTDDDLNNTQVQNQEIHFTNGVDYLRMAGGDDKVYLASGSDEIHMGPDDDKLTFYADEDGTEKISFDQAEKTAIIYTETDDTIEVRSDSGDVVIQLGTPSS